MNERGLRFLNTQHSLGMWHGLMQELLLRWWVCWTLNFTWTLRRVRNWDDSLSFSPKLKWDVGFSTTQVSVTATKADACSLGKGSTRGWHRRWPRRREVLLQILVSLARLLTPLDPFCFWVMRGKPEMRRRLAWWAAGGWLSAFGWLSGEVLS